MIKGNTIIIAGILVILIGFTLVFVGTALQASSKANEIKTGGVILIGPIPIIFGNDKGFMVAAVILAIILMILAYIFFYRGLR
jgi:uncharacterized protein (TIGR00304 family)